MAVVLGTSSGFVTVAPTADPAGTGTTIDGSSVVTKDTAPAGATKITSIGWYRASGTNTANWEIALYSDSAGVAATRLFVDATNSTASNGWVVTAVDWAITPGTAYWLGLQMDAHSGSSSVDAAASGGAGSDLLTSQTTLADPYGGGAVADADGMYAIYALYVPPVTGTGALNSGASAGAGAGVSLSTGTGTPAAQSATIAGAGLSSWTGTGALASGAAAIVGAGAVEESGVSGTGVLVCADSAVAGAGLSLSTGSGVLVVQSGVVVGAGLSLSAGTGALLAGLSTASGAGLSLSTGTGALVAAAADIIGAGTVTSTGSGLLVVQAAAIVGAGDVQWAPVTGTGVLAASAATLAGTGLSYSTGSGVLASGAATMQGASTSATPFRYGDYTIVEARLGTVRIVRMYIGEQQIF